MEQYQEWNGSRWDYTKNRSSWHFDNLRPPVLGRDSYTPVCRFAADFNEAIAQCAPRAVVSSWSTRNQEKVEGELYSATAEEQDLIQAGADPKQEIFARAMAQDVPVFQRISDWLGVEEPMITFHYQTTGQMLHTHIDNFAARKERKNSFRETDFDQHPDLIRRFAIMLSDWQLGQIFQIGNANWTQWRAGDCITWEWQDMPHSTANMGWHPRPMLQITGLVTKRTQQQLYQASSNLVVNI
jgi:hypothetical protein